MPLSKPIKPLAECLEQITLTCEREIESSTSYHRKHRDEKIAQVERNRPIIALLDAAGFDIKLYYWAHGDDFKVDLGFLPSTKKGSRALAEKLRIIRQLIDAKLGLPTKQLENCSKKGGSHVQFTISRPDYPGMEITYTRRLPKDSKCKIVTTRNVYRSLVCEV